MKERYWSLSTKTDEYSVIVRASQVTAYDNGKCVFVRDVIGMARFLAKSTKVRVAPLRLEDMHILYLYDSHDGYGYGINLTEPEQSDWGFISPIVWDEVRRGRT